MLAALERWGIGEPTRSTLLREVPGLSASIVDELCRGLSRKAGAGMRVREIRAKGPVLVEAQRERREMEKLRERERAERERERLAHAAAVLAAYTERYRADPQRFIGVVQAIAGTGETVQSLAAERLRQLDVAGPIKAADHQDALVALAWEMNEQKAAERERIRQEAEAAARRREQQQAAEAERARVAAELKARAEAERVERERAEAEQRAEVQRYKATFAPRDWARLIDAYHDKWPVDRQIHEAGKGDVDADVALAVRSGRLRVSGITDHIPPDPMFGGLLELAGGAA